MTYILGRGRYAREVYPTPKTAAGGAIEQVIADPGIFIVDGAGPIVTVGLVLGADGTVLTMAGGAPVWSPIPTPAAPQGGWLFYDGANVTVPIAAAGTPVLITTGALGATAVDFSSPSAGVLQYDGADPGNFALSAGLSMTPTNPALGRTCRIGIALNGTQIAGSTISIESANGAPVEAMSSAISPLANGDQLQVTISNVIDTASLDFVSLFLLAHTL